MGGGEGKRIVREFGAKKNFALPRVSLCAPPLRARPPTSPTLGERSAAGLLLRHGRGPPARRRIPPRVSFQPQHIFFGGGGIRHHADRVRTVRSGTHLAPVHGPVVEAAQALLATVPSSSGRAHPDSPPSPLARHGAVVETPSHRPPRSPRCRRRDPVSPSPPQPSINPRSPIPTSPGRPGCTDGKPREGGFWYDESNVWITATTHAEMNKGRKLKDYSRVLCRTCA